FHAPLLRGGRQGQGDPALPRPRTGPPGTRHEAPAARPRRLRAGRQVRIRAAHGRPPDDHDPGAPLEGFGMNRPLFGILGTVALSAAVFVSASVHAQPKPEVGNEPFAPFKIGEGLFYVGGTDWTSYLLVTKDGLIVIDDGDAPAVKDEVANIRT